MHPLYMYTRVYTIYTPNIHLKHLQTPHIRPIYATVGTSYAFSTSPVLPTLSLKSLTWSNPMGTSLVHTGCSSRVASGASFPLSSALVLSSFSAKALRAFLSVVAPVSRPSLQDYCSSSFYPSRPFSPPFRCLPPPLYVKRKRNTGEKHGRETRDTRFSNWFFTGLRLYKYRIYGF